MNLPGDEEDAFDSVWWTVAWFAVYAFVVVVLLSLPD